MNKVEKKFKMIVYKISETEYSVLSLNSTFFKPKQYVVRWVGYKWICSCLDYIKHSEELDYACKHIEAIIKASTELNWSKNGKEVVVTRYYTKELSQRKILQFKNTVRALEANSIN